MADTIDRENMKPELREEVERIFAEMGGHEVVLEQMRESHELAIRMSNEYDTLLEQYPDKWVAMSKDGALFVKDSHEELLSEIDSKGIRRADVMVKFLDTNPVRLIL